ATGLKYIAKSTDENGAPLSAADKPGAPRKPVAIDLADLSKRSAALKAIFWDKYMETLRIGDEVARSTSFAAFGPAVKALDQLGPLEKAARGDDAETKKLQQKFGLVGRKMISAQLGAYTNKAKDLERAA